MLQTYSEEEIGNVHGDVDGNSHICKVETVAQPDQSERNHMMQNQLFEILSRLLQHQQQYNSLLSPVTRLQQIVSFKHSFMTAVRESLEHGCRVEIPHWRAAHDVQAKGSKNGKVNGSVELLHETCLFCFALDAEADG